MNILQLPEEIEKYITTFLIKCSYCNKLECHPDCRTCVFCKRSWCDKCYTKYRLIDYNYFEVYVMTCKNCLLELRIPNYINDITNTTI